jgi:hypothetical protein
MKLPMSFKRLMFAVLVAGVFGVVAACGGATSLAPATDASFVDTVTIFALKGTPIPFASGYDVVFRRVARTDRGEGFDLTFDIDSNGVSRIFPTGALGLGLESGIIFSNREFDQITEAPTEDFDVDSALVIHPDSVFVVKSRPSNAGCPIYLGSLPRYGKFEVLDIDPQTRSLTMKALVNVNCGYRALEPGIPSQ